MLRELMRGFLGWLFIGVSSVIWWEQGCYVVYLCCWTLRFMEFRIQCGRCTAVSLKPRFSAKLELFAVLFKVSLNHVLFYSLHMEQFVADLGLGFWSYLFRSAPFPFLFCSCFFFIIYNIPSIFCLKENAGLKWARVS